MRFGNLAHPSTKGALRAIGVGGVLVAWSVLCCGVTPSPAAAQAPWRGWYGPPADGMFGVRFDMDPTSADEALAPLKLRRLSGRVYSLRYEGKLIGVTAELVCDFLPDATDAARERLNRITVMWSDISGGTHRALTLFETLDAVLKQRYNEPKLAKDATEGTLSTGAGFWVRIYQGPEMHAQLDLRASAPERYYVRLVLDYPQLHPELAEK